MKRERSGRRLAVLDWLLLALPVAAVTVLEVILVRTGTLPSLCTAAVLLASAVAAFVFVRRAVPHGDAPVQEDA